MRMQTMMCLMEVGNSEADHMAKTVTRLKHRMQDYTRPLSYAPTSTAHTTLCSMQLVLSIDETIYDTHCTPYTILPAARTAGTAVGTVRHNTQVTTYVTAVRGSAVYLL